MNTEALTPWMRDALLPGVLVLLGGALLLRAWRWVEGQYERDLDGKIAALLDRDDVASESLKRSRAILQAVGWSVSAIATIAAVSLSLHVLGVPLVTIVAPATVISVAVGFGAQQIVGDLLAGFFLLAERQFGYGDVIRFAPPGLTEGVTGTVDEMTLRVTKLRTIQGELVIIPNGSLRQVTNLSKEWSRAVVDLPVATDEDLQRASSVLRVAAHEMTEEEPWSTLILSEPVVTGIESFEIGYVRLRVVARTLPGRQFEVARELRLRLATALTEASVATVSTEASGSS
jgi:moderate conductance mechanosensitive channel